MTTAEELITGSTKIKSKMKHNKMQLKTKRWYKKRGQLFLFRKLTDISKQNTIFVKDVDAPTDCTGSINTSGWGTDLEITVYSKSSVVSDRPSGYAQTICIKNRWATNFTFKNVNKNKKFWKELICLLSLHYLKMSFALKPAFAPT
jgi:hypothetical protein